MVVTLSGGSEWEGIGTELFNSLDARVLIEARDIQVTVGLEFKQERLTVSKGFSVKPDLHIIYHRRFFNDSRFMPSEDQIWPSLLL